MKTLLVCLLATLAAPALAAPSEQAVNAARGAIAKKFPGVSAQDIKPSPVDGVYEVDMGGDVSYVSADGRYIIAGDLYEIDTRRNLTEDKRALARVRELGKLKESDMIVFKPTGAVRHTVTVFTDVDCGYCRKLHADIGQLNQMGIEVRYLAYPRRGPGSADWRKMEAVWCSKDRKTAITQAKLGQSVTSASCATPVANQYELGGELGVRGTPAIFSASGEYIGGYLAPTAMRQKLDGAKAALN